MFYLSKSDDTWTLSYEVGGLRACLDDRWRSSGSLRRDFPNHRCLWIPRSLVEHHAVCSPVPRSRGVLGVGGLRNVINLCFGGKGGLRAFQTSLVVAELGVVVLGCCW